MHQLITTTAARTKQQQQYHQLRFDYLFGLGGPYPLYSQEQIDEAINWREIPREIMLECHSSFLEMYSVKVPLTGL